MAGSNKNTADRHDVDGFLQAQKSDYAQAVAEIRSGRKRTHWMWYIFPQFAGLGSSPIAQRYAIKSRSEVDAYIQHPLLGVRLVECAEAVLGLENRTATEVFGSPDDMKLRSSATLFAAVAPPGSVFERLLDKYFEGQRDPRTLQLLAGVSKDD